MITLIPESPASCQIDRSMSPSFIASFRMVYMTSGLTIHKYIFAFREKASIRHTFSLLPLERRVILALGTSPNARHICFLFGHKKVAVFFLSTL